MKKLYVYIIGCLALFFLAGFLLFRMCTDTNQAMPAFVVDAEFCGEYSVDGSSWQPFDKQVKLPAFEGDVLLRGEFTEEISAMELSFYLNHIGVSISVNGELVFMSGRAEDEMPELYCGSYWTGWMPEGVSADDEVEIRLHNPHSYGNANAYNEFLDSMTLGGDTALADRVKSESMPFRIAGIMMLVVSVALLGMALGYLVQRLPLAGLLCGMGLMTLFMGGYILMDAKDISLHSVLVVFNTCVRQLCIMFAALALSDCVRKTTSGTGRRLAGIATAVVGIADAVLFILCLAGVADIYDTGMYWATVQGIAAVVLAGVCVYECRHNSCNRMLLISYIILLLSGLLELINARVNLWTSGIVVKVVFTMLFILHIARAVKMIAVHHRESLKAKRLEEELRSSRNILAMSQIKTHFIFNVLTAISTLCQSDPEKADETVTCFARYLRSNINTIQNDTTEPFSKSLEQLEDYISLEQIRFGSKIRFVKNLEFESFKIPPLVLQPVVENAIKHGLLPKQSGGTIELHAKKEGTNIIITVADDGIGYDTTLETSKDSVGIENVRFRLQHMVNGSLDIQSTPGKGTKVTIIIPFEKSL